MNTRKTPRVLGILRACKAIFPLLALFILSGQAPIDSPRESILIFRPLGKDTALYRMTDQSLLEVPGGRVIWLELEISAFHPLTEVTVNGRLQSFPSSTWMFLEKPHFLRPGENKIVVMAKTKKESVSKEFEVTLEPLPGK